MQQQGEVQVILVHAQPTRLQLSMRAGRIPAPVASSTTAAAHTCLPSAAIAASSIAASARTVEYADATLLAAATAASLAACGFEGGLRVALLTRAP